MLDVRRLRVLREVAAHGSFSAAAEALSYTQSAVSQQIAALEREAGTRLVERSARGVRLTVAGRARVRLADLADESWMIGTAGHCPDASIFLRACQAAGFEPRVASQLDDYLAIQGFVAAGMGVSFIPDL